VFEIGSKDIFFTFDCIKSTFKKEPMSQARLTNLDYLKEITGGEPEIMQEFIQMFFDQLPEFRDGLTSHLANQKWKELGELAHKAKSSVMTFGMNELGYRLKELQLKTQKLEDIESYPEYVKEFMDEIAQAEVELQEDMK
jgi:HPt (histidine-containing phosphotransfer) domain-containing protein